MTIRESKSSKKSDTNDDSSQGSCTYRGRTFPQSNRNWWQVRWTAREKFGYRRLDETEVECSKASSRCWDTLLRVGETEEDRECLVVNAPRVVARSNCNVSILVCLKQRGTTHLDREAAQRAQNMATINSLPMRVIRSELENMRETFNLRTTWVYSFLLQGDLKIPVYL